jgi:hypothetical protein
VAALVAALQGTVAIGHRRDGSGTRVIVRVPVALLVHDQPTDL